MQDEPRPLTESELEAVEDDAVRVRPAKSQVFSVRLSGDELRTIAREARILGLTAGAFIKRAALDAAETHQYSTAALTSVAISGTAFAVQYDVAASVAITVAGPEDRTLNPPPDTQVA